MAGFSALSVRDLVGLVVIASRMIGQSHVSSARQLVAEAFEVADAFVEQSEGQWANGARANHTARKGGEKNHHR
jgi:hypothetical protein